MNFDIFLLVAGLAGLAVGFGVFLQAAFIVRQKKSLVGLIFKLFGTVAFCWGLYVREYGAFWMIVVFFATLIVSLFVFTLARQRLLR